MSALSERYRLSPKHFADQFPQGWEFDDKVDVFEARIQGWHLDIVWSLVKRDLNVNQLAVIHLLFSYFEMIGKYTKGYLGTNRSRNYFKIGLQNVFPDIGTNEIQFMNSIYSNLRCGLYHIGRPAANVIINDDVPAALGYNEDHDLIKISPTKLLNDIQTNFDNYITGLRNPSNPKLRENFEARFDYDNK